MGLVTLAGTLSLNGSLGVITTGDLIGLISNDDATPTIDPITGTFSNSNVSLGGQSYQISYEGIIEGSGNATVFSGGNDIVLKAVTSTYADYRVDGHADIGLEAADYDNDGVSNLLEYLLGTDPTTDSNLAINYQLNGLATGPSSMNQIIFNRPGSVNTKFPTETGIIYKGQVSHDCLTWTDILDTDPEFVVTNPGTATETVTITDTTSIGVSSTGKRFIRLVVEKRSFPGNPR